MPRKAKELTDKGIKAALKAFDASDKKVKTLTDGRNPGLRLEMTRGTKGVLARWCFKKQASLSFPQGINLGLGAYGERAPGVSLSGARRKAEEYAQMIAAGLNPKEERERVERAKVEAKQLSAAEERKRTPFKIVAEEWVEDSQATGVWVNDSRGADKARSVLKNWINPVLGEKPINEVDRIACVDLMKYRELASHPSEVKARKIVNDICIWAYGKGYRDSDQKPASLRDSYFQSACKPYLRNRRPSHHFGALPPEDMPEFMQQLRRMPEMDARALEFMILTVGRQDSICNDRKDQGLVSGLRWDHLDLVRGIWHQPKELTKMKRDGGIDLMLSSYAVELLRGLERREGNPFVFPDGWSHRPRSISVMKMRRVIARMNRMRDRAELPLWIDPQKSKATGELCEVTPHAMRSTFLTWVTSPNHKNYLRFNRDIADLCLDHEIKDSLGHAYYRIGLSSEHERHAREIMEAWGRYCMTGKWPDEPDDVAAAEEAPQA
ncbi:tyrosine-type recombinase/integrase [Sutterella sp.]|uniref:tyrosine-type recombinase/integrase n=1 Tax=Sutterella sp. TaxID=1981025 RepID=UPI003FD8163E